MSAAGPCALLPQPVGEKVEKELLISKTSQQLGVGGFFSFLIFVAMETEPQTLTAHFPLRSPQVPKHSRIQVSQCPAFSRLSKEGKIRDKKAKMLSIEAIEKQEMKEGKSVYLKGKREGKELELLGDEETVERGLF